MQKIVACARKPLRTIRSTRIAHSHMTQANVAEAILNCEGRWKDGKKSCQKTVSAEQ